MIQLFFFCLCCSFAILAIYIITNWPGMILAYRPDSLIDKWFMKPVCDCLVCMSSIWGTLFYFGLHNVYHWREWMFCVLIIAGINSIICIAFERLTSYGC